MSVSSFLEELSAWAATRPEILGLALVGSYARGAARPDSDVDVVIVCVAPAGLLGGEWVTLFGEVGSSALEDYGALRSRRVFYTNGLEVEFGVTDAAWLRAPLDVGTKSVLAAGARVLYDPQRLLRSARDAAVAEAAADSRRARP